jgi:hypothetical protein
MSRFIALVNGSDSALLSTISDNNGRLVATYEPGVLVIDGDATTAQAVAGVAVVTAVSTLDGTLDTSSLALDDETLAVVTAWNRGFDADYVASLQSGYRAGESWNFPDGCLHSGVEGDESGTSLPGMGETPGGGDGPLVASSDGGQATDPGTGTTDPATGATDPGTGTTDPGTGDGTQIADNTDPQTGDPGDGSNDGGFA